MKTLLLTLLALTFTQSAFAQSNTQNTGRLIGEDSDGIKLAHVLLNSDARTCIEKAGFDSTGSLTQAKHALVDEKGDTTTYTIKVIQYGIGPTDGVEVIGVKSLVIRTTKRITRTGGYLEFDCSYR